MRVIWKDSPFGELYEVSSNGEVRNKRSGRILSQFVSGSGYCLVRILVNGLVKNIRVHRLVASAFIPNPMNLPEVNHKDCNKRNNSVENLEWCGHKDNMKHASRNGLLDWKANRKERVYPRTEKPNPKPRKSRAVSLDLVQPSKNIDYFKVSQLVSCKSWKALLAILPKGSHVIQFNDLREIKSLKATAYEINSNDDGRKYYFKVDKRKRLALINVYA